ncbi:MAG: M24 family metallopeptidase [Candidatus Saccharimonadaceae bacterium]
MNPATYQSRRHRLTRSDGVVVVRAFDAMQQTNDSAAPFTQEANFFYLTGITEPGWLLIIDTDNKSVLVGPDISETHRIFDGGLSDEAAQNISGVDQVIGKKDGDVLLEKLLSKQNTAYTIGPDPHEDGSSFVLNPAPQRLYEYIKNSVAKVIDIRLDLAKMRGIKDADEISKMQQAIKLTCESFVHVKDVLQNLEFEYAIEAEFSYAFTNAGANHAYQPIVAAAGNACTLHYQKNAMKLPKNGLVLMDIGARIDGYCADVTRTYAIGTPSSREVAVHKAVESAHQEIIMLLKPGLSVKEYHERVDEIMQSALRGLGLFHRPNDYRKYFPHAVSHGLGIDVHDPLGMPEIFQPGMVLTVEPGIYIPEEGIGVRIEDDILIITSGHENLSAHLSTSL